MSASKKDASKKDTPKDAHAEARASVMDAKVTPTFASIARVFGTNGKTMRGWIRTALGVYVSHGDAISDDVRAALCNVYLDAAPRKTVAQAFKDARATNASK